MIKGTNVSLRPIAEADLEKLYSKLIDIEGRGPWYPLSRGSLTKFRRRFEEDGRMSDDEGLLVMVDHEDRLVGTVDWNKLNGDVPDMELGYRVFDRADWGKGIASEALDLFASWLFDTQPINRLHLTIHVDNIGSHRVAEKCGFIKEGMSREAWYHKGKWHDIDVYTMTRVESDERRSHR